MRRPAHSPDVEYREMYEAASLAYDQGLTHKEIAARLRISRPAVTRLLQRAADASIVRTLVVPYHSAGYLEHLEDQLCQRFRCLRSAVIVPGRRDMDKLGEASHVREAISASLAVQAAAFLVRHLEDRTCVAVGRGSMASQVVSHVSVDRPHPTVMVLPMVGWLTTRLEDYEASSVAKRLAQAIGGVSNMLPVPALLETAQAARTMARHPLVSGVLDRLNNAGIALTTVRHTPSRREISTSPAVTDSHLPADMVETAIDKGAVGEFCYWYFDENGRPVDVGPATVLGLGLRRLHELAASSHSHVITVVGADPPRVPALAAWLRGGLCNVLVTDDVTATDVLEFAD